MKNNRTVAALALGCLALAFAAAPAVSQTLVGPADELHTAPWFADLRGTSNANSRLNGHGGGFVATALRNAAGDGWETVTYAFTCGDVTKSLQPTPDATTGLVAQLIDCESDTDQDELDLRVHGVESGGWYWVFQPVGTGDDADVAAAAAPLIRMDVLAEAPRQLPLEPKVGGIQATVHKVDVDDDGRGSGGATLFKDDANRLFDILPHPAAVLPPAPCSGEFLAAAATDETCVLGTPGDWQLTLVDGNGKDLSGPVVRPAAAGTVSSVAVTLSVATGHLIDSCSAADAEIGLTGGKSGSTTLALPDAVTVRGNNPVTPGSCPAAGLTFSWTVDVAPDDTRCAASNSDRGTAQTVRVTATTLRQTTPALPADLFKEFKVTCAAASSAPSAGQELVPDVGLPSVE